MRPSALSQSDNYIQHRDDKPPPTNWLLDPAPAIRFCSSAESICPLQCRSLMATAAPPSSVMNVRRFTRSPRVVSVAPNKHHTQPRHWGREPHRASCPLLTLALRGLGTPHSAPCVFFKALRVPIGVVGVLRQLLRCGATPHNPFPISGDLKQISIVRRGLPPPRTRARAAQATSKPLMMRFIIAAPDEATLSRRNPQFRISISGSAFGLTLPKDQRGRM